MLPLYQIVLAKVKKVNFNEFIDIDSKKKFLLKITSVIDRLKKLSKDNANGNDLIN